MVELIVNGETLELDYKTNIKYTKQISDIFDIAKVKASYTNSFSVPKTPNNTQIFKGLGLVGSTSTIPYEKIPVTLKDNGFDVIRNGWLDVKETSDVYKINIIDGAIDFFKDIENLNLGDLDLSEINHIKTLEIVVSSFANLNYRYIIGDYNGKNFTENGAVNIDYLVPSARYKYLLEKLFTSFGWSWSGSVFQNNDYLDSFVSYPKAPPVPVDENEYIQIAELKRTLFTGNQFTYLGSDLWVADNVYSWDTIDIDEGLLEDNWKFVVPETNHYKINIKTKGYVAENSLQNIFMWVRLYVNGVYKGQVFSPLYGSGFGETTFDTTVNNNPLTEGDVVDLKYACVVADSSGGYYVPISIHHNFTDVTISRKANPVISFSEELSNFKITDFFNDFIRRFGLTMIPDNDNRHLSFYTLSERLNTANSVNWSEKYVRRTSEGYLYGSYAQNNYYRHKYNGDNEDFNDGILEINNKNLQNEKTLATTPFYSRTNEMMLFPTLSTNTDFHTFKYPVWSREPKETDEGVSVDYKSLSGRFYVMKSKSISASLGLESENYGTSTIITTPPIIDSSFTHYADLIPKYYDKWHQLLNDCKIHKIDVALSILDIINIDFSKPIYFEQEASYYLINKVNFENDKISTIEAIKINI